MKTSLDIRRSRPWTLAEWAARKIFMPPPVRVRHAEYSMLFSADGAFGKPSERLIDVALAAIQAARSQDLKEIESR